MTADVCEHYLYDTSNDLTNWQHNHISKIGMVEDICEHYLNDASKLIFGLTA